MSDLHKEVNDKNIVISKFEKKAETYPSQVNKITMVKCNYRNQSKSIQGYTHLHCVKNSIRRLNA